MGDQFGRNFRLHIFGESHGPGIGIAMEGVEPGLVLDMDRIRFQMARRAPGASLTTARTEADEAEWISGLYQGTTTGTSPTAVIRNTDALSGDYEKISGIPRPSHADYTGALKYQGFGDPRGGGHFSGRLTAALVLAGAVAEQALKNHMDYQAGSHMLRVYRAAEDPFREDQLTVDVLKGLENRRIPVLDPEQEERILAILEEAKEEKDSVGGVLETAVIGLPAGLGDPFFDSMESRLSQLLFSVPGLKGLTFGAGLSLADMKGSQANDALCLENGQVRTKTNHNGGILGGITNGMPVIFRTLFKPTASIGRPQKTLNMSTGREEVLEISGRHDPCILLRAVPVVEACAAIAVYDAFLESDQYRSSRESCRM